MNLYVICGTVISVFMKSAICRPHLVNSIASAYEYVGVPSLCAVGCIFLGYACIHTMSCCPLHVYKVFCYKIDTWMFDFGGWEVRKDKNVMTP